MTRTMLTSLAFVLSLPLFTTALQAKEHDNVDKNHLAVQGYDVVAYFTGRPAKGDARFAATHGGHTYRFASDENRKAFVDAPDKYVPQYGGWCATAMAKGEKVEIDPKTFKVTNGRLFLFYNGFWGNALKDWNADETALTRKADAAWTKVKAQ